MKKLLVMLVMLGVASMAQADLMLTVNGQDAEGQVIELLPSDYIEIDVEVPTVPAIYVGSYDVALVLSNDQAEFDPLPEWVSGFPSGHWENIAFPEVFTMAPSTVQSASPQYIRIMGTNNYAVGDYAYPGEIIMNALMLHCLDGTDVVLDLVVADAAGMVVVDYTTGEPVSITYETGQVLGSVTLHQIPEPATLALLGLGGLFLRRRRKA